MQAADTNTETPPNPTAGRTGSKHPNRLRNIAAVSLTAFVIGFVVHFVYISFQLSTPAYQDRSAPNDVSVFWATSKLAFESAPLDAFHVEKLDHARSLPHRSRSGQRHSLSPSLWLARMPTITIWFCR